MSIATELTALRTNLANAKDAIEKKGGTVSDTGLAGLATEIGTIPSGGETPVALGAYPTGDAGEYGRVFYRPAQYAPYAFSNDEMGEGRISYTIGNPEALRSWWTNMGITTNYIWLSWDGEHWTANGSYEVNPSDWGMDLSQAEEMWFQVNVYNSWEPGGVIKTLLCTQAELSNLCLTSETDCKTLSNGDIISRYSIIGFDWGYGVINAPNNFLAYADLWRFYGPYQGQVGSLNSGMFEGTKFHHGSEGYYNIYSDGSGAIMFDFSRFTHSDLSRFMYKASGSGVSLNIWNTEASVVVYIGVYDESSTEINYGNNFLANTGALYVREFIGGGPYVESCRAGDNFCRGAMFYMAPVFGGNGGFSSIGNDAFRIARFDADVTMNFTESIGNNFMQSATAQNVTLTGSPSIGTSFCSSLKAKHLNLGSLYTPLPQRAGDSIKIQHLTLGSDISLPCFRNIEDLVLIDTNDGFSVGGYDDNYSFSTLKNTDISYQRSILLQGSGASALASALPNRVTSPYRKFSVAA